MSTRSVAELVIAHIINLSRKVTKRNYELHLGIWNKTCVNSNEIRGKTIGIIGYGIGLGLTFLFGLSSYIIALFIGWIGW